MNIGKAAAAAGLSPKMIRHYEAMGLMPRPYRQASNYRTYPPDAVERLRFIARARALGFPLTRIRDLLDLRGDPNRASAAVKAIALAHVAELEARIAEARAMAVEIEALALACKGDGRPDCPIIHGLDGRGPRGKGLRS